MGLPRNFSWLVAGEVAGCACPSSEAELRGLVEAGVRHLVTLSYADSPPPACTAALPNLAWTSLARGVPRILPGGMHNLADLPPPPPPDLDPDPHQDSELGIKTMRIHSPGLNCQNIVV